MNTLILYEYSDKGTSNEWLYVRSPTTKYREHDHDILIITLEHVNT
jgi:hypothetical protein